MKIDIPYRNEERKPYQTDVVRENQNLKGM